MVTRHQRRYGFNPIHVATHNGWAAWYCRLCHDLSPAVSRDIATANDHGRAHVDLWHDDLHATNPLTAA